MTYKEAMRWRPILLWLNGGDEVQLCWYDNIDRHGEHNGTSYYYLPYLSHLGGAKAVWVASEHGRAVIAGAKMIGITVKNMSALYTLSTGEQV